MRLGFLQLFQNDKPKAEAICLTARPLRPGKPITAETTMVFQIHKLESR